MKKKITRIVLCTLMLLCLSGCGKEESDKSSIDAEVVTETEVQTVAPSLSKPYEIYLREMQEEYPDCVARAVQNYMVNASETMTTGEIPPKKAMLGVIENEFSYDYKLASHWEYTALQYSKCKILPMSTNYVYAFDIEDYLIDFVINDDYNKNMECFSGRVYFQYRIAEDSNLDNVVVRDDEVTVCLEFWVKYSEEQKDYRLIALKYISSRNECETDCRIIGHDWGHVCDSKCTKCGTVKGKCTPGEDATCTEGQYCTVCHTLLEGLKEHVYSQATCTESSICIVCGMEGGKPLGHRWDESSCTEDAYCTVCGEKVLDARGHIYNSLGTCTYCEKEYYCECIIDASSVDYLASYDEYYEGVNKNEGLGHLVVKEGVEGKITLWAYTYLSGEDEPVYEEMILYIQENEAPFSYSPFFRAELDYKVEKVIYGLKFGWEK